MQIAKQVFAYTRRVEPSSSATIEMFIGNAVLTIIGFTADNDKHNTY